MKTISRYIMTLALLLTAATGAWAQDVDYVIDVSFDPYYNPNGTHFNCMIFNPIDHNAEIKGTLDLSVDDVPKGSFNVDGEMLHDLITPGLNAGDHTWSAVFKPEGGGSFNRYGNFTINKANTSIIYYGSTSINLGVGESTELEVYFSENEAGELSYSSSAASVASITKKGYNTYIIEAKAAGTATITFSFAGNTNYEAAEDKKITVTVLTPPIKVTTNAAEEGGTFTEASFEMQTSDATVDYELVRDMSVQMQAQVGDDPDKQPRYRVKKEDNVFKPADLSPAQVMALFSVNDQIEQKVLTPTTDYIVNIYAIDEEGQPTGNPMTFADFTFEPGIYAVKAVAAEGSPYDGESALSNTFVLFQGYEVYVPAGEYVTYYKDEALYVEDEDAKLYTITTVGNETATATELTVAAANTPLLVKNNAAEAKTILLIPTTNATPDEVTPYEGFKGTLQATQITASTATQNNYAFNGKQFVWVKTALAVGQYKAWLEVPTGTQSAPILTLVFGDATGVNAIDNGQLTIDNWYDLNGRKLQGVPTKKGVYIMNGKKVVIK